MVPCPKCGAPLERRVARTTQRVFYGCTRYFETNCRGSMEEPEYKQFAKTASKYRQRVFGKVLDESEARPYPSPTPYDSRLIRTDEFEYPISLNQDRIGVAFFNPPQSYIAGNKLHRKRCNLIITTPTSSGKTAMAEMVIARQRALGQKSIYVSPLKAVTNEKYQEWTNPSHPFSQGRICILTGDHQMNPQRMGEMQAADILLLTSEMLDSRFRKAGKREESKWMKEIGACIVDEAHLLGTDRGPALEVGLMRLTEECSARLIFLSATLPNIEEISQWLTSLNGMPTVTVDLPWRPVELRMHWLPYEHSGSPRVRDERYEAVLDIVKRHYNEGGTLVFVHTKRMGREMKDMIRKAGMKCEFHSGELGKDERRDIENRFRGRELPVLVSTSTLAWGCNL